MERNCFGIAKRVNNVKKIISKKLVCIIAILLIFSMMFTVNTLESQAADDKDIPSSWAVTEIDKAFEYGLTTWRILSNFRADITREEFCELAVKLYEVLVKEESTVYTYNPFDDTDNSKVLKAYNLGIVKGVSKKRFNPENPITRQEICVMIYRTLNLALPELKTEIISSLDFSDKNLIASWAVDAVGFLNNQGIMKGTGNNKIEPLKNTTREEAIALVKRTYEEFSDVPNGNEHFDKKEGEHSNDDTKSRAISEAEGAPKDEFKDELKNEPESEDESEDNVQTSVSLSVGDTIIVIGESENNVIGKLGEPSRKDLSKYGFEWYIFNNDYSQYIQIGIADGKVVSMYSNAESIKFNDNIVAKSSSIVTNGNSIETGSNGIDDSGNTIASNSISSSNNSINVDANANIIDVHTSKQQIRDNYGGPLSYIEKGTTYFQVNESHEYDTYLIRNTYVTLYYDIYDEYKISSVMVIEKETEEDLKDFYGIPSLRLVESFEKQILDLTNATRVKKGKEPLVWDEKGAKTAKKHSKDMVERSFFDHINLDGKSPFERMSEDGIRYRTAGENLACGNTNAIDAHEGWMNSYGHRQNILGPFERLGSGVYLGGEYYVYSTVIFYTPQFD
jgi:uncharacterized protein YkwD